MNEQAQMIAPPEAGGQTHKSPAEAAAQIGRIADKLIDQAQSIPVEFRQDGPNFGSPGFRVGESDGLKKIEAVNFDSSKDTQIARASVTDSATNVEAWNLGERVRDHTAGSETTAYSDGFIRGTASERTPGGSKGGLVSSKEAASGAAKGLAKIRSEVSKAKARQKAA